MQDTIKGVQIQAGGCTCVYMYRSTVWHNSTTCHLYIMWAELGQSNYVPTISNIVTTGNGMGTKNVLWNGALGYVFSTQSSVYGAITIAYSTWTQSTVSFYSM